MNTDLTIYWRRAIEVALLVAALVVLGVYWHDSPATATAVPVLIGLLGLALGTGQSPVSTVSTTFKTVAPPPAMPAAQNMTIPPSADLSKLMAEFPPSIPPVTITTKEGDEK